MHDKGEKGKVCVHIEFIAVVRTALAYNQLFTCMALGITLPDAAVGQQR